MRSPLAVGAQVVVAGLLAVPLTIGAPTDAQAAQQATRSCQEQLRFVEQRVPLITEQVTRAAVVRLWHEADDAWQRGDEQTCKAKIAEAMEKGNIRADG